MKMLFAIGIGSFIGGVSRYLIAQSIQSKVLSTFPYGTMGVNILGCFLIGIVFSLSEKGNMAPEWRLFLATGVLGGFTTFSAFSNETFGMLRDGQYGYAFIYVTVSVLLGLTATFLGYSAIKII